MSAATLDSPTPARPATHATGPKTPQGKAAASRNAVTHGLHAQDVVLPHLGESQEEFEALCDGLARELSPRTAVERHYVTQIAQAMWRLRRLTRWEAGLYDDPALTDEERITKMARVLRHDAALRRHIDRALKPSPTSPTNCQNEPAPAYTAAPSPSPAGGGGEAQPSRRGFLSPGGTFLRWRLARHFRPGVLLPPPSAPAPSAKRKNSSSRKNAQNEPV